ncbi:hypothetical protein CBR_g34499 [Chara braunii]|uniref:Uncharacterized protein n=1 Tax=Chara braunii TaxID=69332 RepID=A0A388LIX1_CHABU|nr:hypothetical protein CBR_g34499 [Chara braunii]|eukprot:GBG82217.1 hypothetical protein CBR_g34499 [Chara braunii]
MKRVGEMQQALLSANYSGPITRGGNCSRLTERSGPIKWSGNLQQRLSSQGVGIEKKGSSTDDAHWKEEGVAVGGGSQVCSGPVKKGVGQLQRGHKIISGLV